MSKVYSTIPNYDVSIYTSNKGVVCAMCSFGDYTQMIYQAESTEEMIRHLEAHERKGDIIPQDLKERLLEDDAVNYSEPSS